MTFRKDETQEETKITEPKNVIVNDDYEFKSEQTSPDFEKSKPVTKFIASKVMALGKYHSDKIKED